ncbi:hypothetical protein [Agromyces bauzanensis]
MTNSTPTGLPGASGTGLTPGERGTTDVTTGATVQPDLKDDAASLAREAGDAGHQVAAVAKGETKAVASETRRQARRLARDARAELRTQAATQQARVASGLRSVGGEFSSMADRSAEPGMATDLVREAGQRVDRVAQWLDARDPGSLLLEVKTFARRRPGVFLAIAVGAGVVAGRLTRALATPDDDEDAVTSGTRSTTGRYAAGEMPDLTPSQATGIGTPVGTGAAGTPVGTSPAGTPVGAGATGTAGAAAWNDPTATPDAERFTETPSVEDAEFPMGRRDGL